MKELLDRIVKTAGVGESQARSGAGLLFRLARDRLGAAEFDRLADDLPGVQSLIAAAPKSGGIGRLMGGFAALAGGGRAAMIAQIVGGFGQLGLSPDHARAFGREIREYLRTRLDPRDLERIESLLSA